MALAKWRIPAILAAEVASAMKYPKRTQYKHCKKPYRVRNWGEYDKGLRQRGDLTIWFSEEAIKGWKAPKTGRPGGQRRYLYRYKQIIGAEMKSRTLAGQRVEVRLGCRILNRMASLGMPDSYRVG